MEHGDVRMREIQAIPRHSARDMGRGELIALTLLTLMGLTGILGTLIGAWWLALM